ncbi:hypothetical protein [Candidatus Halobonum tyrrellensis]|uniref:Uncharacterized protein n=1 Tax=Candidatus Halobonum tyrrellensis G22 TaxID=1324957 RepID=V4IVN5_9EURY|nr:hypothetical protein [Candidatus Halobonum tyrrellensis]ESP87262.1 hypothetical protein K933_15394 [Candidatus Halobonum tyrrellensis G22]
MSETRAAEDWLIRYLVIGVVMVVATLALLYALSFDLGGFSSYSIVVSVVSVVVLAAAGGVMARDLQHWRSS